MAARTDEAPSRGQGATSLAASSSSTAAGSTELSGAVLRVLTKSARQGIFRWPTSKLVQGQNKKRTSNVRWELELVCSLEWMKDCAPDFPRIMAANPNVEGGVSDYPPHCQSLKPNTNYINTWPQWKSKVLSIFTTNKGILVTTVKKVPGCCYWCIQ